MKKLFTKLSLPLALALVTFIVFSSGCSCDRKTGSINEEAIVFKDPVFGKLLKEELGKDEVFPKDLSDVTGVQISADKFLHLTGGGRPDKSIIHFYEDTFEFEGVKYTGYGTMKSLEDLVHFPELSALRVTLQPEIDYSTIPTTNAKLAVIFIYQSKLTDVSFVSAYPSIKQLVFNTNNISDVSPIASCTALTHLTLDNNNITDISSLSTLKELKSFSLYSNKVSDISVLENFTKLEKISFYNNKIKDISPLAKLPNLKAVEMINNQIEDVSPLKNFTSFEELRLSGNPIKNLDVLKHIENLEYEETYG
ncbi:MAG: Internalin-A precursor [Firmicutes bacterium ADurb.Bin300]|nr:MAG: Internalin-A precursor [Firmicutes bacterium ADurb.Bin300]